MLTQVTPLSELPLWVFDESTLTPTQIRKRILSLKAEQKISMAVVDYAQIVMPEIGDNREQQVANVARTLCATAKDAKIALVVLSQLNDEGRIRESRVISHEAHNVIRIDNDEKNAKITLQVQKGRRIPKKDYLLYYDAIHCRLASVSFKDVPETNSTHPDP